MIAVLLFQPEESVNVTIVHVGEQVIKATQNLLCNSSVTNNYYTDIFIEKSDINRAD
jgi:hypothetical protein